MAMFADGPVVEVTASIDASVSAVWALVTDINIPARFQDEFQGAEWIGNDRGLGASFRGMNERGERAWETTSWVVDYEPERLFSWAVSDVENPGATWTYVLEPADAGTLLTFRRKLGPGPSGLTAAIAKYPDREAEIIANRDATHVANMTAVVEGIKMIAEGG